MSQIFPWLSLQRELWRLSRDRRRIQRQYAAKYAAAEKEGKSKDELWALLTDKSGEDRYVDESIIAAQYCPVNLRGIGEKANSGAAFRMTKGVSDLNQK